MADKFTRLSVNDGDVLYGDSNSNDSIEELEDNIDEILPSFGTSDHDLTEGTHTGDTNEALIGQVTLTPSTNDVRQRILVIASGTFVASSDGNVGGYKINIGTDATGLSTDGNTTNVFNNSVNPSAGQVSWTAVTVVEEGSTDFDGSTTTYVSVTGQCTTSGSDTIKCKSVVVVRI